MFENEPRRPTVDDERWQQRDTAGDWHGEALKWLPVPERCPNPPPVVECFCGCFACGSLIACAISPIYGPFSVVISYSRCSCSASRNGSSQAQDEVFNVFILSRWWCVSKLSQRQRRYCADFLESAELLRESRHQVAVRFSWTSRSIVGVAQGWIVS